MKMIRSAALAAAVTAALTAVPAQAADKTIVGGSVLLVGGALTALAFDYRGDQCPTGYTLHTYDNLPSQCSFISTTRTDIREATTAVTLKRRGMMWSGVAAMGLGAVIFLLPDNSPMADIDIGVARGGWRATKTIGW